MRSLLNNAIPEPHTILGIRLKPLAVGHLLYLQRFGVESVNSEGELVTALLVCSRSVEEIQPTLDSPLLALKIRWWLWRVSKVNWLFFWRRGYIDWPDKIARWESYFKEHTSTPSIASKRDGNGDFKSKVSFLQHLKVVLQSKLNHTPSEALNAPFSSAVLDYYIFHECEGSVEIVDAKNRKDLKSFADENSEAWIAEAKRMRQKK